MPALFTTGEPAWREEVVGTLKSHKTLSDFYGNAGGSTTDFHINDPNKPFFVYLVIQFQVVDGALCVTDINAQNLRVNTKVLTRFLAQLPFLRRFNSDRTLVIQG